MKKNENNLIHLEINQVNFFLCSKNESFSNNIFMFPQEITHFSNLKNDIRKKEFLGTRYLRNKFDESLEIGYLTNGKPIFKNSNLNLSISHSKNYIGLVVAPFSIGLDIEECHERIFKVRKRFLNEEECALFNEDSSQELTIAWSAKEALFKLNENDGLDFKSDLIITDWDKNSKITASMRENSEWKNVNVHLMIYENLVICFNFEQCQ